MARAEPKQAIRAKALELGFDACRFTAAHLPPIVGERLAEAIAEGRHAGMDWLSETVERRRSPRAMWAEARYAILLGMNYGPQTDPMAALAMPDRATISVYARNRDYHAIIKGRLKTLAQAVVKLAGGDVKVFVDTAPLMEKPLAAQAGLGWQGKHTNLVSREFGSWLFLGAILTTADFEPDEAETDHCGSCRACLDICPTAAFPTPYKLDAGRCISYLTIEHKGPIPRDLRAATGNRIFGCDDCLAVCPWNKFARIGREAKLQARADLDAPQLAGLAALDDASFRAKFAGSPVRRAGRDRFLRNVLVAIGNSGLRELAGAAMPHLHDGSALVRGAAVWALSRLLPAADFAALEPRDETDEQVREEWSLALTELK